MLKREFARSAFVRKGTREAAEVTARNFAFAPHRGCETRYRNGVRRLRAYLWRVVRSVLFFIEHTASCLMGYVNCNGYGEDWFSLNLYFLSLWQVRVMIWSDGWKVERVTTGSKFCGLSFSHPLPKKKKKKIRKSSHSSFSFFPLSQTRQHTLTHTFKT